LEYLNKNLAARGKLTKKVQSKTPTWYRMMGLHRYNKDPTKAGILDKRNSVKRKYIDRGINTNEIEFKMLITRPNAASEACNTRYSIKVYQGA
jgi:hypothetical protein